MKRILLAVLLSTLALSSSAQLQRADETFKSFLGRWVGTSPNGKPVIEEWTADATANRLVGRAYQIRTRDERTDTVLTERLSIEQVGGAWAYVAEPMGQERTVFPLARIEASAFVFENLKHDFPQRIGYEFGTSQRLTAWIEGPGPDGAVKRFSYAYCLIGC